MEAAGALDHFAYHGRLDDGVKGLECPVHAFTNEMYEGWC